MMSSDRRKNEVSEPKAGEADADWLDAISDVEKIDADTGGPDIVDSEPTTGLAERFRQRQHVEPTLTEDPGLSIDPHSMERIRRGKMPIEAQVDLHGCTQEEALGSVDEFLPLAMAVVSCARRFRAGLPRGDSGVAWSGSVPPTAVTVGMALSTCCCVASSHGHARSR